MMKHWVHLGTQKAASSFLRGLAAQLSGISLACRQELNFFGFAEDQSYEAYVACFPDKRAVLFENSPVYFREGARCAPALAMTLGSEEPILSLLLRDPVEAIISHHDMRLRQGFFEGLNTYTGDPRDLAEFARKNPEYLDHCRYMELLERHWLPHFSLGNFEIRMFEEFTSRPVEVLREIAVRAGVDEIEDIEVNAVWKNPRPSSAFAYRILAATGRIPALGGVRRRAMAIPALRKLAAGLLFKNPGSSNKDDGKVRDLKAELTEMFRPDVDRLCKFLGRERLPWENFFANNSGQPIAAARTPTVGSTR